MKNLTLGTVLITAISLSGCNDGSTDKAPSNLTELEGKWISVCDNSLGNGASFQASMDVSGNEMILSARVYDDADCIVESTSIGPFEIGVATFTVGSSLITSSGLSAQKIDILAQELNGETGPFTEYDIFRISEGKLYVGDTSGAYDGNSDDTRPIDLDLDALVTKI